MDPPALRSLGLNDIQIALIKMYISPGKCACFFTAESTAVVLFVTLPTPNYLKILQIKRRYSIIHSDEYYVRLFYPLPSVIIS